MPSGIYDHLKIIPWNRGMSGKYHLWPKGRIFSKKHKKNLSLAHKGLTPWNFGKKWKPEIKTKMSMAKLGKTAEKCVNWKGGVFLSGGYWRVYSPNHPNLKTKKYIKMSHFVAEKYLKRYLIKKEIVHHINGIKTDDSPRNLYIFSSDNEHRKYHTLKDKPILKSNLFKSRGVDNSRLLEGKTQTFDTYL